MLAWLFDLKLESNLRDICVVTLKLRHQWSAFLHLKSFKIRILSFKTMQLAKSSFISFETSLVFLKVFVRPSENCHDGGLLLLPHGQQNVCSMQRSGSRVSRSFRSKSVLRIRSHQNGQSTRHLPSIPFVFCRALIESWSSSGLLKGKK